MKNAFPYLLVAIVIAVSPLFISAAVTLPGNDGLPPDTVGIDAAPSGGGAAQANTTDTADSDTTQRGLINPLKVDSLRGLTLVLFDVIKTLLEIVLVAAIVWSGFLFIKAQGNEKELTKAKETLMYTIIGGIMVLGINVIYEILVATIEQL